MARTTGTETIKFSFVYNATKETAQKTMASLSDSAREKLEARFLYLKLTLRPSDAVDTAPVEASISDETTAAAKTPINEISSVHPFNIGTLPLEIFLEIASELHPSDLLTLCRLAKDLRAKILSRNSRVIWTRTFDNAFHDLGLPLGCPPDMSEPQYASYLFEKRCSACGNDDALKVHFCLRLRFCATCEETHIKRGVFLAVPHWMTRANLFGETIWRYLPCTYSKPDRIFLSPRSCGCYDFEQLKVFFGSQINQYSVAEFERVAQDCTDLQDDKVALKRYLVEREMMVIALMQLYEQSTQDICDKDLITTRMLGNFLQGVPYFAPMSFFNWKRLRNEIFDYLTFESAVTSLLRN
ncbi:hypothetical protein DXG01_002951 [Tephrocybe rancida]|nr:hypothetical protein DXG01_002951 [Tephrocybe rancida]